MNDFTGEQTDRPPTVPVAAVKTLAQSVELPVIRTVTMVKEEGASTLTKHVYYLEYQVSDYQGRTAAHYAATANT